MSAGRERVLLELARHRAGLSPPPRLPAEPQALGELWRRASEEGLRGLLVERALRQGLNEPRLERARLEDFAHASRLMAFGRRLGRRLEERGGRGLLVLKGAALVDEIYGGRLAQRPMSDLDLLPHPESRAETRALLLEEGMRPGHAGWHGPDGLEVDLHEDLVGSELLRARRAAFRFDTERLFERARPLGASSPGLLRLGQIDQALHLSVHALKHGFGRWIWLLDLALLLPRLPGPETVLEARRTGSARALACALRALEAAFGAPPPRWAAALPTLGSFERAYVDAATLERPGVGLGGAVTALSIDGWRDRGRYLAELLWPAESTLRAAEGGAGSRAALRVSRLLRKALPGSVRWLELWRRGV
ncbi:MAG: nucleotidyltransferase family protein [Acidobacteriota bacterium]